MQTSEYPHDPEKVIRFIETYCICPDGQNIGQPIVLEQWQKDWIRDTYRVGVLRSYLTVARKNGKSTLVACIVLAHILGPCAYPNSKILSCAHSEDQAAIIYQKCVAMIELNPVLETLSSVKLSPRKIIGLSLNVEYRPSPANKITALGGGWILIVFDETGAVRGDSDEFIDSVDTAQGSYDHPLVISMSTQAKSDQDLFSVWIDDALTSGDPSIIAHVYAAQDDKCDVMDRDAWRQANPGLGTIRKLSDFEQKAQLTKRGVFKESKFRNFYLNQRIETFDPFVQRSDWTLCAEEPSNDPNLVWYGALDLSSTTALTSYTRVAEERRAGQPSVLHAHCRFWLPENGLDDKVQKDRQPYDIWADAGFLELTEGSSVRLVYVAEIIIDDLRAGRVSKIAYDRWHIDHFFRALYEVAARRTADGAKLEITEEDIGAFVSFGQGYRSMTPALRNLEEIIVDHRLRHGGNPVLEMCAKNAVIQTDGINRKLIKASSKRHIDGMITLTMAASLCSQTPDEKPPSSIYDDPEIVELLS